jgi:hypothetical protein
MRLDSLKYAKPIGFGWVAYIGCIRSTPGSRWHIRHGVDFQKRIGIVAADVTALAR